MINRAWITSQFCPQPAPFTLICQTSWYPHRSLSSHAHTCAEQYLREHLPSQAQIISAIVKRYFRYHVFQHHHFTAEDSIKVKQLARIRIVLVQKQSATSLTQSLVDKLLPSKSLAVRAIVNGFQEPWSTLFLWTSPLPETECILYSLVNFLCLCFAQKLLGCRN